MKDEYAPIRRMSIDEAVTLKLLCVLAWDLEMAVEARRRERYLLGLKNPPIGIPIHPSAFGDINALMCKIKLGKGWKIIKPEKLKTTNMKKDKLLLADGGDNPPSAPPPMPPKPKEPENPRTPLKSE